MIPIAFDTETFLITREKPSPQNVCLTWCDGEDSDIIVNKNDIENFWIDLAADPDILFIAHNAAFDFCSLYNSFPKLQKLIFDLYRAGRVTDTGIRQQLFDIATGKTFSDDKVSRYSLARIWEVIFEEQAPNFESKIKENPDSWRLRYGELADVLLKDWPQDAIDYALVDAEMVYEIYQIQEQEASDYFRDDTFQTYAAFCLNWISINGMKTSPVKTILFLREQQRKYDALIPKLEKAGLIEYDKKKKSYTKKQKPTQLLIQKACKKVGRDPLLTDKGKELERAEQLPKDPLKYLATDKTAVYWSEDPLLKERLDFVAAEKMLSTYIPVLRKGYELPISTRIDLAATGRTTSSSPREPLVGTNLQNWPRKTNARNCFVPRDGYLFLAADFSGAELHTLAQTCKNLFGVSTLGDALNDGIDVHLYVASTILGISYKEALRRYKKGDKEINEYRFYSKMANFGFGGGMAGRTWCMQQLERTGIFIDPLFGKELRENWIRAWPEMRKYFRYASETLKANYGEYVLELFYSKRLTYVNKYTVLCNRFFQSLAADGSKKAICEVIYKCMKAQDTFLSGCIPVNFVHDELILEIPDYEDLDYRDAVIEEFIETMEDEFNKVVPDYPTTVDAVLMDCWNKNAKKIIDSNGHWRCDRDG